MSSIPDDYAKQFNNTLIFFNKLTSQKITPLVEKQLLAMLPTSIPFFTHLAIRDSFPKIERLTINKNVMGSNRRIHDVKFLTYPRAEKVKNYGRCNLKGQSVFYGSFGMMGVLSELKPRIGDLITMTTWEAKPESTINFCPIFKNQPKGENLINPRLLEIDRIYKEKMKWYSPIVRQVIDNLMGFVANAFTRVVRPGNDLDYVVSAYFSDKILYELGNGSIDAIYYPSVQQNLSFENIAIKPTSFDKHYKLTVVKESVVINDPSTGSRGTMMQGIKECKEFDNGIIPWSKQVDRAPSDKLLEYQKRFGLILD